MTLNSQLARQLGVKLGNRQVGHGHPCFVIAEAGVNHNGDVSMAHDLIQAAADAGADAIKFQTFKAENLASKTARKGDYQIERSGADESQFAMLKRLELSDEAHQELKRAAEGKGLVFLSTPFDLDSVNFLEKLGVEAYKISSGDLTDFLLLSRVAQTGKPVILSTGMADMEETREAYQLVKEKGSPDVLILHCVSNYPTDPADCNLRAMQTIRDELGAGVGFSDHTLGRDVALAAIALGACLIEKHLTLDRNLPGPDHFASLNPADFKAYMEGIRQIEKALGTGNKVPVQSEKSNAQIGRKSLHWKRDLPSGHLVTLDDLIALRPGTGISPKDLNFVLGRRLHAAVLAGTMITKDSLS